MTHSAASLPAVFSLEAAPVPFCGCRVYQKLLRPPICRHPSATQPCSLPFSPTSPGPSRALAGNHREPGTECDILTCHKISVQALSSCSSHVQRRLQALPAHAGLNLF